MGFSEAIRTLLGLIPSWLSWVLAIIGAGIFVFFLVKWLIQRSSGGGMRGFPVMAAIVGGILAAPLAILPAIALLVDAVIRLIVALISAIPT